MARNRGDVPAPFRQSSSHAAPAAVLVFEAAAPPFLKDWIGDGSTGADENEAHDVEALPLRQRHAPAAAAPGAAASASATSKKSDRDAIEGRLEKKRRRAAYDGVDADAATPAEAHGLADAEGEGGDSKLAVFAQAAKREKGEVSSQEPARKKKTKKAKGALDHAPEVCAENADSGKSNDEKAEVANGTGGGGGCGGGGKGGNGKDDAGRSGGTGDASGGDGGGGKSDSDGKYNGGGGSGKEGSRDSGSNGRDPRSAGHPQDGNAGAEEAAPFKRPKKRSRLKNIRKDNRPLEDRPAHLRPEDPSFQGRLDGDAASAAAFAAAAAAKREGNKPKKSKYKNLGADFRRAPGTVD
ncbi:unnamed protein product [Phaeothamnion confervicola]